MKNIALVIPILLATLILATWTTFSAAGEKDALIALYYNTNGDNWTTNTNWITAPAYYTRFSGPIPAELANLSNLQFLYLDGNPALVCWERQAALTWAQGLFQYWGPHAVCHFVHLPLVTRYSTN